MHYLQGLITILNSSCDNPFQKIADAAAWFVANVATWERVAPEFVILVLQILLEWLNSEFVIPANVHAFGADLLEAAKVSQIQSRGKKRK